MDRTIYIYLVDREEGICFPVPASEDVQNCAVAIGKHGFVGVRKSGEMHVVPAHRVRSVIIPAGPHTRIVPCSIGSVFFGAVDKE